MIFASLGVLWLAIINLRTVRAFRDDKRRAREGRRRISEAHLLGLAMMGGSPGALFARHHYRHKTRKQPFGTNLTIVCLLQIAAIGFAVMLAFDS